MTPPSSDYESDDASISKFDNIPNFRDVGETVNEFLGRKVVRVGQLYRSARPDDATPEDRRKLKEEIGIKMVMDLRTKTEHLNAAKKRKAALASAPVAHATSNAAAAEPLQIPGIKYLEIKLTGRRFEWYLLGQLSAWSYFKFIILFLFGFRMRAISILGREVIRPRGLVGLAVDTLDLCGLEIKEALESFLEPDNLPVLVHCTQGKDRTGIVVMLALMVVGVPLEAIDLDYQLSDEALRPEKESRLAEIREIGLTDEFGDTAKDLVDKVASHLQKRYKGLDKYLDGIGFTQERRERLRDSLAFR